MIDCLWRHEARKLDYFRTSCIREVDCPNPGQRAKRVGKDAR